MTTHKNLTQDQLEAIAVHMAESIMVPCVVCLWGDLGAGKSTFARAFIQSLMPEGTSVPSPTFNIVQTYSHSHNIISHFDLYRIHHTDELVELNIHEAFHHHICLIEWPERLGNDLPTPRVDIHFTYAPHDLRDMSIKKTP